MAQAINQHQRNEKKAVSVRRRRWRIGGEASGMAAAWRSARRAGVGNVAKKKRRRNGEETSASAKAAAKAYQHRRKRSENISGVVA
jgi:NADPH-dependent glutamate synthase beta subunit-like oxidoreductase